MPVIQIHPRRASPATGVTAKYRSRLPQLQGPLFLADGGLETTLIYGDGCQLPYFASFDLLKDDAGTERLRRYFVQYARIAQANGVGIVLESPTWRASADWGTLLGYDAEALADANRRSIGLLLEVRAACETPTSRIVISGNLGPRGDGYVTGQRMSVEQAAEYHAPQINTFAATDADMVSAFTLNYVEEAIGVALAAKACALPTALSFTVETDGRLPSGESLQSAIERTDAASGGYPAYYMINCAHPEHFANVLNAPGQWRQRIRGVRANASRRSHAELDNCTDLDAGDPIELGAAYRGLRDRLPGLIVVGGCCGTDHRHVGAMYAALAS